MRIPHVLTVQGDRAVVVEHRPYESEKQLQKLLADHPELIPIPDRRLFFLGGEIVNGAGTADLVFLDDQGLPTLVETKLLKNPEARRAVIGQVLDYAAAMTEEWQVRGGRSVADLVRARRETAAEFLGDEEALDGWFAVADLNLARGRMRFVLALDEARDALVRLVRYLNDNSNLEVYLLEVRHFSAGDQMVLAPTLIGYKAPVSSHPGPASGNVWEDVAAVHEHMGTVPHGLVVRNCAGSYFQVRFAAEPQGRVHYEVWNIDMNGDGARWLAVVLHLEIRRGKREMLRRFEKTVQPKLASFTATLGREVKRRDDTSLLMSVLAEPAKEDFSPEESAKFVRRFIDVTLPDVEAWARDCGLFQAAK